MSHTESANSRAWLRILELGGDVWLGLVDEELYVGDFEAPKRQVDVRHPIALLPLLEKPRDFIVADIRDREIELGFAQGALTELVPLDALPGVAVSSEMDYWVWLAMEWLSKTSGNGTRDELLRIVERSSWATQKTRHRAVSLRKIQE